MHTLCHPIPGPPTPTSLVFPDFPLSFVCECVPLICICSDGSAENYDSKMWPAGCAVGKMGDGKICKREFRGSEWHGLALGDI